MVGRRSFSFWIASWQVRTVSFREGTTFFPGLADVPLQPGISHSPFTNWPKGWVSQHFCGFQWLDDIWFNREPQWPLFLKVNPSKQGLFQANQGSFGFYNRYMIYMYIYMYKWLQTGYQLLISRSYQLSMMILLQKNNQQKRDLNYANSCCKTLIRLINFTIWILITKSV